MTIVTVSGKCVYYVLQTRLADVEQNRKDKERDAAENKEIREAGKKENDTKDEDTDKTKRAASHLIAFFSQSKSSKNKDKEKEKENAKEKEKTKIKEKDKEKGRSTPPPGKQTSDAKSTPGGKLERRGSEGKSWRKSLGILGGSSKHDKEDKHKRHSDPRLSMQQDVVIKNSQTATSKQNEKKDKSDKKQMEKRSTTPPVELPAKNSSSVSAVKNDDRSALKTVKEEKEQKSTKPQSERRSSNPTAEIALKNSQSRVKTSETATPSSKNVPLREKKGRATDERREKSRSLGDIDKRLHNIGEVSILDPSVPPSRTVDTMDIPDQVKTGEKRPKSSAALLETTPVTSNTPLERKPLDINGVLGINILKEHGSVSSGTSGDALKNANLGAASNGGSSTEHKAALDKKPGPALLGSGNEVSTPGSTLEKKSNLSALASDVKTTGKASSPAKTSRSGSGSSFLSDISELSAELSAAIASPPPEPIRLGMSEANLLSTSPPPGNRRSPIGKDHGEKFIAFNIFISTNNLP